MRKGENCSKVDNITIISTLITIIIITINYKGIIGFYMVLYEFYILLVS